MPPSPSASSLRVGGGTYIHSIMHKFMAWEQSPLGKECFDFNDATNPPYRRLLSFDRVGGRVVANDALPISVKASVTNAEARYAIVTLVAYSAASFVAARCPPLHAFDDGDEPTVVERRFIPPLDSDVR
jgi:hypothetical protein